MLIKSLLSSTLKRLTTNDTATNGNKKTIGTGKHLVPIYSWDHVFLTRDILTYYLFMISFDHIDQSRRTSKSVSESVCVFVQYRAGYVRMSRFFQSTPFQA